VTAFDAVAVPFFDADKLVSSDNLAGESDHDIGTQVASKSQATGELVHANG